MLIAGYLASPAGRWGRVAAGTILAGGGPRGTGGPGQATSVWTVLLVMLGAEVAVGGILNVCILCPLFGLPFQGRRIG